LISRRNNPRTPSVLSIGKVEANGATNVIPNEVKLEGTFRTFNEEWRTQAHNLIKEIAENTALAYGCEAEVKVKVGYPFLNNSEEYTQKIISAAETYMGKENVVELDIWLAGEDFAFYSQHVDACFYRLGTRNESRNITSGVHTPTFDIDEEAIKTGMGLMAYLTIYELENS
jgi:amidohydrolase